MKNTKRILAVVIALTMVIGMFASVSAASKKWYSDAVTYLEAAGIAKIGTKAETKLTRAEFVLWVAKLEAGQFFVDSNKWKNDGLADVIVFSDVDTSVDGIYRAAINYCYQRQFVRGNGDGTFSPDAKVTLAQASAVIVRLMGYDNKVTNLEDWQYNYFNVANNYCNAFDATFAANLPAVDAEYELTYGEAAYLLATILNWGVVKETAAETAKLPCLTAEGENLGEKFPRGTFSASSQVAIVTGVEHIAVYYDLYGKASYDAAPKTYANNGGALYDVDGNLLPTGNTKTNGEPEYYGSEGSTLNYKFWTNDGPNATWTSWGFDENTKTLDFVTNVIDPESTVTLNLVNEDGTVTESVVVDVAKLQQLVRVALGKSKNVDVANGEVFNLGDYINNGSVVGVEVSAAAQGADVKAVSVATEEAGTRLVSDTFLVLTSTAEKWVRNLDGSIVRYGKYPYLANAEGSFSNTPALPTAYTDAKKVSVSGSKLTLGETTYSIVATRSVGANEIVVYDATAEELAPLTDKQVANMLPNTAQGEHDVEFTDVDGDGYFDIAVIRDYSYFKYVNKTNADPASSTSGAKYNQGGAVVIDKKVINSANSDSWKYDSGTSGKIQLVVQASNKHNAIRTQYYDGTGADGKPLEYPMQYYKVVDIAALTTAYIESVEKDLVTVGEKTYYQATLVSVADGTKAKVLIPTSAAFADEYTNIPVEIAGQKASIKVYSADWMPFLATENAAREAGIDQAVNEAETGAWLVDRTVKYATKNAVSGTTGQAGDMVCVLLDTTTTAATGFIVNVAKTETGDNTYNVTLAKSGNAVANINWVSALDAYFTYGKTQNSWTTFNWDGVAGSTTLARYAYRDGFTLTMREKMEMMGFTDPDAWVTSPWATKHMNATRTTLLYAKDYAVANTPDMDDITVFDVTLADYMADATYTSKAYDILYHLCSPASLGLYGLTSDEYIYIAGGKLSDDSVVDVDHTKDGWVAEPTRDYPAEALALTFRDVLDMIDGFDTETFYENLVTYKDKKIQTNNHAYWNWLSNLSNMIIGGYFTKSKNALGFSNEFGGKGNMYTTQKGYFTSLVSLKGAVSVGTYEVRASASSIWDWDNYSVYHGIFAGQTLKEHNGSTEQVTGYDLTYVTIKKDGANTQYVLQYLGDGSSIYAAPAVGGSNGWSYAYDSAEGWWGSTGWNKGAMTYQLMVKSEASYWEQYASEIVITDVSKALGNIAIPDGQDEVETELELEVATDPYYKKIKSTNGDITSFERHWTVGKYTVTVTSKYASGDPIKTYIPVVDINGVQIKVTTQEEKDAWEKRVDEDYNHNPSTYEVSSTGLLYKVNTLVPEYKYDANGKKVIVHTYDFENMVPVATVAPEDVVVKDEEIVGLIKIEEMTNRKEAGYFPGAYHVTYDGVTYIAAGDAPVVIMTPNFKTGDLDGTATTVEALAQAGAEVFVTYAQVAKDGNSLTMLSVIGELVDKTAQPQQPTETEKTYLVYLAQEGVTIEALEQGKYFVVRSTYSASEVPSCEDFGSIYRKYSTYTEAKYAAEVDVAIGTGYYSVKEDGEIVKAAGATKKGEITEVDANGNIKATMDGKKVDATSYKWTFIYEDFDGNLHVAGSSIKVTIASKADVLKSLDSAKKALANAEKDYADAKALKLSAEMQATLKSVVDEKAAALETAKQNAITKYLDGQFWGTASSPVYNYVNSYKYTYQKEPSPVTFQYTVIDGTYVVFVSSFFA